MPEDRVEARVGDLYFDPRYADPVVDVDTEATTVEKQTVTDDIVVQYLGRRADRITIDGIVLEDQVEALDNLVEEGEVSVRTHRWSGQAIVLSTASNYTHSYDLNPSEFRDSEWVYEVKIDLIEVNEVPSQAMQTNQLDQDEVEELISGL